MMQHRRDSRSPVRPPQRQPQRQAAPVRRIVKPQPQRGKLIKPPKPVKPPTASAPAVPAEPVIPSRPHDQRPGYLTMAGFGRWGRFGNQLFQYAFLRAYARRYGLHLELPLWVGEQLFENSFAPPVLSQLRHVRETYEEGHICSQSRSPVGDEFCNRDFGGYAQFHTSYFKPDADYIRGLFRPVPAVLSRLQPAAEQLRQRGRTVIGFHFRRGDYGRGQFYITPTSWYRKWLEENLHKFVDPVLFIATEDPALVEEFRDYQPCLLEDLGINLIAEPMSHFVYLPRDRKIDNPRAMDFFPDFWLLTQCDVLVIPNSTFSFAAGMLNPQLRHMYRSRLTIGGFEEIDPWDSYPLTHEKAEDYAHLEGVCLTSNPYWPS